jgi:hypothetical protein
VNDDGELVATGGFDLKFVPDSGQIRFLNTGHERPFLGCRWGKRFKQTTPTSAPFEALGRQKWQKNAFPTPITPVNITNFGVL